jgi:hypothetical protein
MLPIDEVHRMLDLLESARGELSGLRRDVFEAGAVPSLCEVVVELDGWVEPNATGGILGMNAAVINRFKRFHGQVRRADATAVLDRLRTYLRGQDQARASEAEERLAEPQAARPKPFMIEGEQWVAVQLTSETKAKINVISTLLDSIIQAVKHSNAPPEAEVLTELERQQLIVLLETALGVLKGPMVEKGLLKRTRSALESGATKAIEKGSQEGLGQMMGAAKGRIIDLIQSLFG